MIYISAWLDNYLYFNNYQVRPDKKYNDKNRSQKQLAIFEEDLYSTIFS